MSQIPQKYSHLKLKVFSEDFKYVKFESRRSLTAFLNNLQLATDVNPMFVFQTAIENSAIVKQSIPIPSEAKLNEGWFGITTEGEMPFGSVQGLIATVSGQLFENKIGVTVISTFDADFIFVKINNRDLAIETLKSKGWELVWE
jgi:hypothetical protein